jgi:hypothetical protein
VASKRRITPSSPTDEHLAVNQPREVPLARGRMRAWTMALDAARARADRWLPGNCRGVSRIRCRLPDIARVVDQTHGDHATHRWSSCSMMKVSPGPGSIEQESLEASWKRRAGRALQVGPDPAGRATPRDHIVHRTQISARRQTGTERVALGLGIEWLSIDRMHTALGSTRIAGVAGWGAVLALPRLATVRWRSGGRRRWRTVTSGTGRGSGRAWRR